MKGNPELSNLDLKFNRLLPDRGVHIRVGLYMGGLGGRTYIRANSDDDIGRAIVSRLEELIKSKYLFNFELLRRASPLTIFLWVLLLAFLGFCGSIFIIRLSLAWSLVFAFVLCNVLWFSYQFLERYTRKPKIFLKESTEEQNFWAEHRDQVWLYAIFVIIGIAGTVITQWLSRKLGLLGSG